MASAAPRTAAQVRREANSCMEEAIRGYRAPQVRAYVRSRLEEDGAAPTYGQIAQELDFYDRAYRVVKRLRRAGLL
jgi:hypothetical protein